KARSAAVPLHRDASHTDCRCAFSSRAISVSVPLPGVRRSRSRTTRRSRGWGKDAVRSRAARARAVMATTMMRELQSAVGERRLELVARHAAVLVRVGHAQVLPA